MQKINEHLKQTKKKENNINFPEKKPIITLALFAYNHEKYINEALAGVFNQTYSPLQIIIIDDCSEDETLQLIEKFLHSNQEKFRKSDYIFLKNAKNLGFCETVNRAFREAKGELFIFAAGDDVSKPNRVESLYEEYIKSNKEAYLLLSNYQLIDAFGNEMKGDYTPIEDPNIYDFLNFRFSSVGAVQCIHKVVYSFFGPIHSRLNHEDQILAFRALLLGKMQYCSERLVLFRKHGNSISSTDTNNEKEIRKVFLYASQEYVCWMSNIITDYFTFCKEKKEKISQTIVNLLVLRLNHAKFWYDFYKNEKALLLPVFLMRALINRIDLIKVLKVIKILYV